MFLWFGVDGCNWIDDEIRERRAFCREGPNVDVKVVITYATYFYDIGDNSISNYHPNTNTIVFIGSQAYTRQLNATDSHAVIKL